MEKRFEYEISVDDKVVWKGLNPTKVYDEIRKKYPDKEVAIAWKSKQDILVCRNKKQVSRRHLLLIGSTVSTLS